MSKFSLIQERLTNAFPQFLACFSIDTRSEFKIFDYKGQSYLVSDDNKIKVKGEFITLGNTELSKTFNVLNAKNVGFIPLDGDDGLIKYSVCDFIVFDDNDFCFVEIKLNATSTKRRAVGANRGKAIDQLSKTVDVFNAKLDSDYCQLNLEAYVSTPNGYPIRNIDKRIAFLEKHKGFKLIESDEKICR